MSAYTDALTSKPAGLDARHERVARVLFQYPEGTVRDQMKARAGMDERAFRERCEEIAAAEWLPVIVDFPDGPNTPGRYRIARAHEAALVADEADRHYRRAVALHKRSRGLREAFKKHHHSGALFVGATPDLEVA